MGCTQSKIENEEPVVRCRERKQFMKEAVSARNAFAAAHSAYAMAMKNTGAALSDYAHGEAPQGSPKDSFQPTATATVPIESLPPPPPPLPNFPSSPLQRAVSLPGIKIQKSEASEVGPATVEDDDKDLEASENEKLIRNRSDAGAGGSHPGTGLQNLGAENGTLKRRQWKREPPVVAPESSLADYFFASVENMSDPAVDEDEDEDEEEEEEEEAGVVGMQEEKKIFEKGKRVVVDEEPGAAVVEEKMMESPLQTPVVEKNAAKKKAGGEGGRRGGNVMNLMQIFVELDDHFLKASESAHEVSKLLEATRLHYHSNFADNRGHIDHSARVMRVITWNRSFRGIPNVDDAKDDWDSEEQETHATVLDKMLAWEKKLYDEVKAGEHMKFEYQKKVSLLNKRKKRSANPESLEKLKAAVSHLHTRYIVDMQSMDSTVLEVNRLRDEQLYPKLLQLVDRMAEMWESMLEHHKAQEKIVVALKSMETSQASPKETSRHHHERTLQLLAVVREWHTQFCKLIDHQKGYVRALSRWLKLNLIPIESSLKEKISSPPREQKPPVEPLLLAWHDALDKLADEVARTAINNFAAVVETILQHQDEEMKKKERCEHTRRELNQKTRQFQEWHDRYVHKRGPDESDPEGEEDADHHRKDAIAERRVVVQALQKQLTEDEAAYQKQCLQVREKSLTSLKTRLPELFRVVCDIAGACSDMYRNLL